MRVGASASEIKSKLSFTCWFTLTAYHHPGRVKWLGICLDRPCGWQWHQHLKLWPVDSKNGFTGSWIERQAVDADNTAMCDLGIPSSRLNLLCHSTCPNLLLGNAQIQQHSCTSLFSVYAMCPSVSTDDFFPFIQYTIDSSTVLS